MEAKLPVILHDQLSSVDYSCCRFPQKESNEYCCSHKEEKFRELQALEWAENAHFGSEKRETEKNERSVF